MRQFALLLVAVLIAASLPAAAGDARAPLLQVFGDSTYAERIDSPDTLLGFPHGQRAASPEEIHGALQRWAQQSDRIRVLVYGRTHQGRPLSVAFVASPELLARIDTLQGELDELADPRRTSEARAARILEDAPAVGYLAHSIHGNETSGADAAIGLIYHLLASNSVEVQAILQSTILIIDPQMNPDGRARTVADLRGFATAMPSFDEQQLSRGASWPFGRGNHYVFDMNRDWIYATQPETRGRLALLKRWHPLLFVDAHEMGAQDTFLFSPPRAPINPHFAESFRQFGARFAQEQAQAFDRRGWVYYSGEWNEGWYPGYTDAWGGLRGAVNILYEQARVADQGVRQANQRVLRYQEGVARQLGSAWANIESLARHGRDLQRAFWEDRKRNVSASGPYAQRVFAIPADAHPSRIRALRDNLALQNIEVHRLTSEWRVTSATDLFGRTREVTLPRGTLLIGNRQPLARLVANLFEFDPRPDAASLNREREELLRNGAGTIYDVTAWNLPMMYGLEAFSLESSLPSTSELLEAGVPAAPLPVPAESAVGYLISGRDDGALPAAAALLREGLRPRVALKDIELDGRRYPRGSLVLTRFDHRDLAPEALREGLRAAVPHLHEAVVALGSGQGPGDYPDLGGGEFGLLQPPQVAVLGRGRTNSQSFGFIWHYLEQGLGLTPSLLDEDWLGRVDLRRYNVIIAPERWGPPLAAGQTEVLQLWVEGGGTLIALGNAAAGMTGKEGPAQVRTLEASFENLVPFRSTLAREWIATQDSLPRAAQLWSHTAVAGSKAAWPEDVSDPKLDSKALAVRDEWQQLFMPRGAFVASRCNPHYWLSMGCDEALPVLVSDNSPLMVANGAEAPFRLGLHQAAAGKNNSTTWSDFGWAGVPPGHNLLLRMGGLLWPEAQERLANTAWVTREARGRGQIVLFANPPVFRGATLGMQRVLGNAVVYGPGLGAAPNIAP